MGAYTARRIDRPGWRKKKNGEKLVYIKSYVIMKLEKRVAAKNVRL
jgi:hypothetical protein